MHVWGVEFRERFAGFLRVGAIVFAFGCADDASRMDVVVQLRTDLVAGEEFDRVQLVLTPTSAVNFSRREQVDIGRSRSFLPADRVAVLADVPPGSYRLDALLQDSERGEVVSQRPALLDVSTNVVVTLPVDRSCLNVACPPRDNPDTPEDESTRIACLGGVCVDPRCTLENLEFCEGAGLCTENADCESPASCATGECLHGVCWARPVAFESADACSPESDWCHPEHGCLPHGADRPTSVNPSCSDGQRNGDETGVDCGGRCAACPPGEPTCFDGQRNGDELGIDCGGSCRLPCRLSTVVDPTCIDGQRNGDETGVDCGGLCTPCSAAFDCETQIDIPVHECLALVAIYNALGGEGGPFGPSGANWLSDPSPCAWRDVTCEAGGVRALASVSSMPQGELPPEIGNLTNLVSLWFAPLILSGKIPPEIGRLSKLENLYLEGNQLSDVIPPELGELSELRELALGNNQLSGTIPIELGNLANLERLALYSNDLRGNIPAELAALSKLEVLGLARNELVGGIPSELGDLPALETLSLSNNPELGGEIPPELGNLTALTWLEIRESGIESAIPVELGNLDQLVHLDLGRNDLTGAIPDELGDLSRLRYLDLASNNLSGSIPPELGSLTALTELRLFSNALDGTIPAELQNLSSLTQMLLQHNQLSGSIPSGLENLTQLRVLALDDNDLRGAVPQTLQNLGSLMTLDLSENACLWATECVTFEPWLAGFDADWQTSNTDLACMPPPEACP